jgi:hypothetical protein
MVGLLLQRRCVGLVERMGCCVASRKAATFNFLVTCLEGLHELRNCCLGWHPQWQHGSKKLARDEVLACRATGVHI